MQYCGSGAGVGGRGSVNGMVYTRGDSLDFAQWPTSWQWEVVAAYFRLLEQRLGVRYRKATDFTEACIKSSIRGSFKAKNSLNDGEPCGSIHYNDMNFQCSERRSSYMAFIHWREDELELLTLKTETRVHKILFDDNRAAVGIVLRENGAIRTISVNREVILCAGALETPKLLMLSGVGPRAELKKFDIPAVAEMDGIGRNLQDHPNVCIFYKTNRPVDFYYPQVYGFNHINRDLDVPDNQADVCYTFFSAPSVIQETLKKMLPRIIPPERLHAIRKLPLGIRALVDLAFKLTMLNRFVSRIYGIIVILGKPVSRGGVRLNSTDPEDQALIDLGHYSDPADARTLAAAFEFANKIATQPELQVWGSRLMSRAALSKHAGRARKWMNKATTTTYHYCGTCAMGGSPESPVTPDLKLRGLMNVRIADASVMPEIPVSATNAASMVIGYRAAEFILQETTGGIDVP